jgi:hypothetical protein
LLVEGGKVRRIGKSTKMLDREYRAENSSRKSST